MKTEVNLKYFDLGKLLPGKFPSTKFPPIKLHSGDFPPTPRKIAMQKIPTWNIPTHILKYFHQILFVIFFHYCHRYHWYYLKGCFVILCFQSAKVTLVSVSQNNNSNNDNNSNNNNNNNVLLLIMSGWESKNKILQEKNL